MKLLFILFLIYLYGITYGQTYKISDIINGKQYELSWIEKEESDAGILYLYNNTMQLDSFLIYNMRGVKNIQTQHSSFLIIAYAQRGGSNIKIRNTAIFCVKENKIVECLKLQTENSFQVNQTYTQLYDTIPGIKEKKDYNVELNIKKDNGYYLELNEKYNAFSVIDSTINESWSKTQVLKFNKKIGIFADRFNRINKSYNIIYPNNIIKTKLNSKHYTLNLNNQKAIYLNNRWYFVEDKELYP